ncbi:uncharacterized protein LOC120636599 [Pararge aegeria]|uniref:uncharacterized protein LOC120636599 n=1 Tax=Pararge aegeria TaxID=116150 RepID=UPI0019D26ACA|nr:uncharacterized protein LOC120636599 [Pararge aegeria]
MVFVLSNFAVGGGVSIFAHNNLKHNFTEELSQDDNHYLWIHLEKLSLDIGAIYKPGRTNVKNFLDTFSLQLDRRKRAVVFGDFNFDLLDPSSSVEDYKDTLTESGFKIINKIDPLQCTRETTQNKSLIDHISTNLKENRFHLAIIESSMSDHKQIYFEIDKYQPQSKPKIGYEAIDYIRLYKLMENNKVDNINENYTEFECKLSQTIKQCKVIKVKILNPPRQGWINRNILDKINQKNILWQKHKNNPKDEGIEKDFIRERNTVAKDIQLMKSNYYLKRFFECKNKPKKMWDLLNSLANNKTKEIASKLKKGDLEVKDGNNICEYFNDFFSTVGLKLAEAIPTKYHSNKTYTSSTTDANYANYGLSNLNLTTSKEIITIINKLDSNTSSGIDNINTRVIKSVKGCISDELTRCINTCFRTGTFPTTLKIAKVTPIYKSGPKSDPSNYRPISVLPVLSKIFEKFL